MGTEIVEHDNIAGREGRRENLLDIGVNMQTRPR